MKFLNFDRVLCLAPHPDDVEYAMMGTIRKYQDTHFDIFCMTVGGQFDETSDRPRHQEVINVWENVDANVSLLFSETYYMDELGHDGWVNFIETKIITDEHACIFIPTSDDSHFEHKFVNELSYPLTRIKNLSIIEYRTPSTLDTWYPNMFVDITDHFDEKFNQLQHFTSQKDRWYFQRPVFESFHLNYQSYKKGIKYVEKFKARQLYRL